MTTRQPSGDMSVVSARSVPAVSDGAAMREWAELLVARAREEGVDLTGEGGLLMGLVGQVLQTGLEVEMADHLGCERHDPAARGSGNSRNGVYPKTVTTEIGDVELAMPRDRNASFEPVTVPKGARRLDGLSGNVISLYAKGLTTGNIQAHLLEIYGTEISRATISRITDAVVEDMTGWQNRPLDRRSIRSCDRCHCDQGAGLSGGQPARVRGHRRQPRRRTGRVGLVVGTHGRGGRQAVDDDADRSAQPRRRRRVDRVLRRAQGPPGCDPGDLAPSHGPDLCGASGAQSTSADAPIAGGVGLEPASSCALVSRECLLCAMPWWAASGCP
jgi:putative transposase